MIDAVAIMGPTGVGKSALAVELAIRFNGEIVSIDSRQAYKHLDIGTAKPLKEDMNKVTHHLIDILELTDKNNAEFFANLAIETMQKIKMRGRLPLAVGGTGLYFRAIFEGLFQVELDKEERKKFAESVENIPTEKLRGKLREVDPETYMRLNKNDRYRIVRALEVFELTGIPISEHFKRHAKSKKRRGLEFLKIGLTLKREKLYERINKRTVEMFEKGWVDEVRELLNRGVDPSWPGMKTLGYPEIIDYLNGMIEYKELIELVARLTRQYAKRQLTWFKKEKDVVWFQADEPDLIAKISELVRRNIAGD